LHILRQIRIWPCLDHIISSFFKMIHPWITNKLNGQFLSLILKPLEFFSCQQSLPTTLDENSSRYISYFIIVPFFLLFLKLAAHWLLPLTHQVLASSSLIRFDRSAAKKFIDLKITHLTCLVMPLFILTLDLKKP